MTDGQQEVLAEPAQAGGAFWKVAKGLGAAVFAAFGVVLLIATKSTAGGAFLLSALLLVLPFHWLIGNERISLGLRAILIVVLSTLALRSIGNTDIVPGQATSGFDFVDRVGAISQRFLENIGAKSPPPRGPEPGPHKREMDADE